MVQGRGTQAEESSGLSERSRQNHQSLQDRLFNRRERPRVRTRDIYRASSLMFHSAYWSRKACEEAAQWGRHHPQIRGCRTMNIASFHQPDWRASQFLGHWVGHSEGSFLSKKIIHPRLNTVLILPNKVFKRKKKAPKSSCFQVTKLYPRVKYKNIYKYKKIQYTEKCLTFNSKLAGM